MHRNRFVIIGIACCLAAVASGVTWLVLADRMAQPGMVVDLDRIRWLMALTMGLAYFGIPLIMHSLASSIARWIGLRKD